MVAGDGGVMMGGGGTQGGVGVPWGAGGGSGGGDTWVLPQRWVVRCDGCWGHREAGSTLGWGVDPQGWSGAGGGRRAGEE